jgi:hypothetical protein
MRRFKWYRKLLLVSLVTLGVPLADDLTTSPAAAAADGVLAHVLFSQPLTPEEAAATLVTHGVTARELQFRYAAGDREWSGGAAAVGDSPRAVAASYRVNALTSIEDMLVTADRASVSGAADPSVVRSLQAARGVLSGPVIFGSRVLGPATALDALARDGRVREVRKDQPNRAQRGGPKPALAAPAFDHVAKENWVPDQVMVWIEPSTQSGRYVQQQWYWDTSRTITFDLGAGWEAEFRLNNSDGSTYLTRNELCCSRIPDVLAWLTDMPSQTYLDTRLGQSNSEYSYTLGSVNAPNFLKGRWYYAYVRTINGDASTDLGRVEPQYTVENFPGCDNTWCMNTHSICTTAINGNIWIVGVPRPASSPANWYRTAPGHGCL